MRVVNHREISSIATMCNTVALCIGAMLGIIGWIFPVYWWIHRLRVGPGGSDVPADFIDDLPVLLVFSSVALPGAVGIVAGVVWSRWSGRTLPLRKLILGVGVGSIVAISMITFALSLMILISIANQGN